MTEQELKNYLINFVQEFATKRNTYEKYVREQDEAQGPFPYFDSDAERLTWLKEHPQIDWFDEFRKLLEPLYETYVTNKQRVYGGPKGYSFGFPPKFDGIENPVEANVELKNKNRAEVYFKTETDFEDEYLFVMLRKADEWKIDSYKVRMYGEEKWDNKIL
jgi:hypothetical protein